MANKIGNKGFDIAKKVCYNISTEMLNNGEILDIISDKVSPYAIDVNPLYENSNFKGSHYKKLIPEALVKAQYSDDAFVQEFIRLFKEVL